MGSLLLVLLPFLQIREMTIPSVSVFNQRDHLCISDVAVNDRQNTSLLKVSIKQSKTDPFWKGVALFLGKTSSDLCAVAAMVSSLQQRGTKPGPLFQFKDGHLLTRGRLVEALQASLMEARVDDSKYCSHSHQDSGADGKVWRISSMRRYHVQS